MKLSLVKMLALSLALIAAAPWFASAAGGKEGKGHRGSDPLQAALEKLDLTADQKAKAKVITDKLAADRAEFMKEHGAEVKAAREAKDKEKMRSLQAPMMEKQKTAIAEIKGLLTDEQKKKFDEVMPAGGHHKKNQ